MIKKIFWGIGRLIMVGTIIFSIFMLAIEIGIVSFALGLIGVGFFCLFGRFLLWALETEWKDLNK